MFDAEVPTGIALYAWEHGALWPLEVKRHQGQGGTLGYKDKTHGLIPKSTEIEVRYERSWPDADGVAKKLEQAGYGLVLVIKGMPQESEVGRG